MQKSTAPNTSVDESQQDASGTPVVGDADAVQKTTWVVGKGTDDRADHVPGKRGEIGSDADLDPSPRHGTADSERDASDR